MKKDLILDAGILTALSVVRTNVPAELYLSKEHRVMSPGSTTYYIDPADGKDTHSGLKKEKAWRTFGHINRLTLAAGDQVKIIAPGAFDQTLMITGSGNKKAPIEIHFAPGRYDFFPSNALRRKYHISNTNDDRVKKYHLMFQKIGPFSKNNILLYIYNIFGEREELEEKKKRVSFQPVKKD